MTSTAPRADRACLWDPLGLEPQRPDMLLAWDGAEYVPWSRADWLDRAERFAAGLKQRGIAPGDRVACLLTNSPDACAAVLGTWLAGGCLLSLPLIARGMDPADYVTQLTRIVAQSQPRLLACDAGLAPLLEGAGLAAEAFQAIDAAAAGEPAPPGDHEPAFVQYSSGSTSEPRGCVLTPDAIATQLANLAQALDIDPERDTGVVWLPLSHDMGLFGCLLLTYWTSHRLVLSTPQRFLTQPASWFDDCARFGATVTAAPNFALDLATRVAAARMPGPFPMRRLVVGGERVEPATLDRAAATFGPERIPRQALMPAYGLAEAVLAVTMSPLDAGPTLSTEAGVELASAGRPLPGCEVAIDASGEILVRSESLAEGYLDAPEATADRFTPEGLRTGDLGFVRDGDLYVTGRLDDLMSVAGRNVYARDVELCLTAVSGVRPGGCAVVDVDTRLVAVIEPRAGHPELTAVAADVRAASRAGAGVMIDECVFVPRGRLPKTPSGKVQRFRCRELAASGGGDGAIRVRL